MSCIVNDGEYGCHLITKYLLDRGHRRIYGIFGSQDTQISIRRKIGFQKAMEEFSVWDERLALMDVNRVQTAYEYAKEILSGEDIGRERIYLRSGIEERASVRAL